MKRYDHLVADLDVGHRRTELMHPPRVLVAGCVRQLHLRLLRPLALLDVEVGPTQPGGPDSHHDVERPQHLRLIDVLDLSGSRYACSLAAFISQPPS
jgi:hypothetical protein